MEDKNKDDQSGAGCLFIAIILIAIGGIGGLWIADQFGDAVGFLSVIIYIFIMWAIFSSLSKGNSQNIAQKMTEDADTFWGILIQERGLPTIRTNMMIKADERLYLNISVSYQEPRAVRGSARRAALRPKTGMK
jgi:hypothetical protein